MLARDLVTGSCHFLDLSNEAERSVLLRATVKTAAAALGPVEWNVYLHLFIFSVLYVQCKKK